MWLAGDRFFIRRIEVRVAAVCTIPRRTSVYDFRLICIRATSDVCDKCSFSVCLSMLLRCVPNADSPNMMSEMNYYSAAGLT